MRQRTTSLMIGVLLATGVLTLRAPHVSAANPVHAALTIKIYTPASAQGTAHATRIIFNEPLIVRRTHANWLAERPIIVRVGRDGGGSLHRAIDAAGHVHAYGHKKRYGICPPWTGMRPTQNDVKVFNRVIQDNQSDCLLPL